MAALPIDLDRARRTPLAAQIYWAIRKAIETVQLASGAKLPSWRDLAAHLGVSRATVRVAYGRLIDEQFVVGLGAAGTRVAGRPSPFSTADGSVRFGAIVTNIETSLRASGSAWQNRTAPRVGCTDGIAHSGVFGATPDRTWDLPAGAVQAALRRRSLSSSEKAYTAFPVLRGAFDRGNPLHERF